MSFTPILTDQALSYAGTYYRNASREAQWGTPVYFTPHDRGFDLNGFGGPHYNYGYNYNNSPEVAKGNCTWWCCGRLREALGKNVMSMMNWRSPDGAEWYDAFTGTRYVNGSQAVPGDIICFSGGSAGHVMFIEKIENGIIYISQSAWSSRIYWDGYACRVNSYAVSDIYPGSSIDMYKGDPTPYYVTVIGIIHTGDDTPPENPIIRLIPTFLKRRRRGYVTIK